jgi:inorganic pyrophosphatase/exopolyphosphatase
MDISEVFSRRTITPPHEEGFSYDLSEAYKRIQIELKRGYLPLKVYDDTGANDDLMERIRRSFIHQGVKLNNLLIQDICKDRSIYMFIAKKYDIIRKHFYFNEENQLCVIHPESLIRDVLVEYSKYKNTRIVFRVE